VALRLQTEKLLQVTSTPEVIIPETQKVRLEKVIVRRLIDWLAGRNKQNAEFTAAHIVEDALIN